MLPARKQKPSVSLGVVPEKAGCVAKDETTRVGCKGGGSWGRFKALPYLLAIGVGLIVYTVLTLPFDPAANVFPAPHDIVSGLRLGLYKGALALGGAIVFTIFTVVSAKRAARKLESKSGKAKSGRARRLDNVGSEVILNAVGEYFAGIMPYL